MTINHPFAIDRLRAKQRGEQPTSGDVETEIVVCEHPYWLTDGDGHGRYWYNCSSCGQYSAWAPWVIKQPPKIRRLRCTTKST